MGDFHPPFLLSPGTGAWLTFLLSLFFCLRRVFIFPWAVNIRKNVPKMPKTGWGRGFKLLPRTQGGQSFFPREDSFLSMGYASFRELTDRCLILKRR